MTTVGVIGGMGPAATVDFFARVVKATPAGRDQDHLHLIINSDPTVPDRNKAIAGTGPSSGPAMAAMARSLERAGADVLVIACNTAHAFLPDVRKATRLPVIDMVEETVAKIARLHPGARQVGLLAVDGCLAAGLYQKALAAAGLVPVVLEVSQQADFMKLIYRVKAGADLPMIRPGMRRLAMNLVERGAQVVVAACTEVPLVLGTAVVGVPVVSSTDALVERTIEYARRQDGKAA